MVSEAKKLAQAKYDEKTAFYISLKLNRNTDKDLIEILESAPNKQAIIKEALRQMKKAGK